MSTIKFSILSLFVLMFSLTSSTTTYASNPMIVNEAAASLPMYKAVVHVSQSVVPNNTPVQIMSKATYGAGDLVSLTLYVNGTEVATSATNFVSTTYTPTNVGMNFIIVVATYSGTTAVDAAMLEVQ